jgi:hypothetical protein
MTQTEMTAAESGPAREGEHSARRTSTMNAKAKWYRPEFPVNHGPKVKAIGLRFAVTAPDWEKQVKRAFDLVKSSGQELNVTFNLGRP